MKTLDLTGQKRGMLTALRPSKSEDRPLKWVVQCDCGTVKEMVGSEFKKGITQSCGCLRRRVGKQNPSWKGYEGISRHAWVNLQAGAKRRNHFFAITLEEAWKKFLDQNRKCALSGEEITFENHEVSHRGERSKGTASLDRIDSSKGYIPGNIQWVHKRINKLKSDYPEEEFLFWCKKVAKHNE